MVLSLDHRRILLDILERVLPGAQILAYGSRARGENRRFSDLDLLVRRKEGISFLELSALKEAFSLSDLPFFVDVQNYDEVSDEFLDWVKPDLTVLK